MPVPEYRFSSRWSVEVPGRLVYDVLADLAAYPEWWPQVRNVEVLSEDHARVTCRSFLPYTLRFEMFRIRSDRRAGVLEARLLGDLDGWARWTVGTVADSRHADLHYEQRVTTPGRLLTALGRLGRPILELNHAWMMRGARIGLQRRLLGPAAPAIRARLPVGRGASD